MMKTTKTLVPVLFMTLFLLTACSKAGPQGPAGQQGKQGVAGPTGPKGEKGDRGTVNVIYSKWINIDWNYLNEKFNKGMRISENRITENLLNKGAILMYISTKTDNAHAVLLLPTEIDGDRLFFAVGTNTVEKFTGLVLQASSVNTDPVNDYSNWQVRYILIPGGLLARISSPYPNFRNYNAVCEYYGIPE